MSFRRLNGIYDVRAWVAGDGPTVLYLHDFGRHPGGAPFLESLARSRRVVAPEHPGWGESGSIDDVSDLLDIVLHYRRLIEKLGAGPVDVVGHGLGGMFAAELAAICPQAVRRLVLTGAYGLWVDAEPLPDPFVQSEQQLAALKWADPANAPDEDKWSSFGAEPLERMLARTKNLAAATKFLWPIPERGLRRRLPLVEARSLVLHGECDALVPASYARELAALLRGVTLELMPGAGHQPMFEDAEAYNAAVTRFLGS